MAYRRTVFDEKKIAARIVEGRGSGEGKDYDPWFHVREIPSSGRSSRPTSWKTGRIHHLLSDIETRYFYLLDWSDEVIDIREQFPLLDREHAQSIANRTHIKYPVDPKSRIPIVLTTDFMITVLSNGRKKYIARTVKPPDRLDNKRTIDKFDIERTYWEERGIDWGIYEETESSLALARNIEWVHTRYWIEDLKMKNDVLENIIKTLKKRLLTRDGSVLTILNNLDCEYGIEPGKSVQILMHLIARKQVVVDMYGNMDFKIMMTNMVAVADTKSVKERLA